MTPIRRPSFFSELQRRHVYQVGASYAVAGWLLVQVATQVFPFFDIPNLAVRIVVLLVIAGFPVALVLAWLFDLTPEGVVRTNEVVTDTEVARHAQTQRGVDRKLNYLLAFLLVASLGYLLLEHTVLRRTLASFDEAAAPPTSDKSIAVLPFENLSDDKANAYFASGIQDEVLTQLAKVGDLKVISRTSTAHYASRPEDLPAIAKELGVANLLEGSVQKVGDEVHVNVQLIRAATDAHLWAETYNRKLDDIFGMEGELATEIAEQLKVKLSGGEKSELARKPTQNKTAYSAFLMAQAEDEKEESRITLETSIEYFKQAIVADPAFAEAWIGRARERLDMFEGYAHRPEDAVHVKQDIDEALRLKPDLPEAWRILGRYERDINHDYSAASKAFAHALQLAPNDAQILLSISKLDQKTGDWEGAMAQARRVVAIDPRNPSVWHFVKVLALGLRRYREAEGALERQRQLVDDKDSLDLEFAEIYLAEGDLDRATPLFAKVPFNSDSESFGTYSAYWRDSRQFQAGIDAWTPELADAATRPPEDVVEGIIQRGELYACAGMKDKANADFKDARKRLLALRDAGATNYEIPISLGPIEAALGLNEQALTTARQILATVSKDPDYADAAIQQLARVEMMTGHADDALDRLEASFQAPGGISAGALLHDCDWDELRGNSRFQRLLEKATEAAGQ